MQNSVKRRRRSRTQFSDEEIRSLLQDFNNQDALSVVEFCREYKIHKATFYNWRKRYATINAEEPKGFLPVQVTAPTDSTVSEVPALFAEVNGIRLYHFVSADYLKALVS